MAFINVLVLALCITISQGQQDTQTLPAIPLSIVYLTPSEIKTLEAQQAKETSDDGNSKKPQYSEAELLDLEETIRKQLEEQNLYPRQTEKTLSSRPPIPIEEPNTEKPLPYTPGYEQHLGLQNLQQLLIPAPAPAPKPEPNYNVVAVPESNLYIKIHKTPNLQIIKSNEDLKQKEPQPTKAEEPQWSDDEQLKVKLPPHQELTEQIKDQVKKLVEANFASQKIESDIKSFLGQLEKENVVAKAEAFKKSTPIEVNIKKQTPKPKPVEAKVSEAYIAPLKLIRTLPLPAPKTEKVEADDQKADGGYQKFLSQIARENALAKAKAYGTIPSSAQQLTIKEQKPETTVKHVIIPPSQSYYELKPIEVKVPQSFDVEIDKPPTYDKLSQVPLAKSVLDNPNHPYYSERFGPKKRIPIEIAVQKPQKYTIIRHIWKH